MPRNYRHAITSVESQMYIDTGVQPFDDETEEQYCDRAMGLAAEAHDVDYDDYGYCDHCGEMLDANDLCPDCDYE